MNFTEVAHQIYNMAKPYGMPCIINDMRINSEQELKQVFRPLLVCGEDGQFIYEHVLPDGRWFCKIIRRGTYFDYIVPDTREQEAKFIEELFPKKD